MKRYFILLIVLLPFATFAQTFDNAIGIRGGFTSGFEYRFYTDDANSYKLLLGARDNGVQLHAFKEFHQYDLFDFSDRLVLFYGAGAHIGYEQWQKHYIQQNTSWYEDRTALIAGIDGIVGVEYLFYDVPISVGVEAKPYFDLFGREVFDLQLFDLGFTVKYLF